MKYTVWVLENGIIGKVCYYSNAGNSVYKYYVSLHKKSKHNVLDIILKCRPKKVAQVVLTVGMHQSCL